MPNLLVDAGSVRSCMSKTIKQFDYHLVNTENGDKRPTKPYVKLVLDNWSPKSSGAPSITPHLMHEDEIDSYIQLLKADLDDVGRRAKAALRRAQEATAKDRHSP